jgi:hypothetical protein
MARIWSILCSTFQEQERVSKIRRGRKTWPQTLCLRQTFICLGDVVLNRVILGCFLGLLTTVTMGDAANEASLRVPFVFKFLKFIEWPAQASSPEFRLCALGATGDTRALIAALDKQPLSTQTVSTQTPNGQATKQLIQLTFLDDPVSALDNLKSCQMIYRPVNSTPIALPSPLPPGVLLVADDPDPYESNVGIALARNQEGRIEFAISMAAVKQSGVSVSSQLLKLARYRQGGR